MVDEDCFNYDVAISYAGPDRWAAEHLIKHLKDRNLRIFYDRDELAKVVGLNLHEFLTDLYQNRVRLCVILISAHYIESDYTKLERQAAQARDMHEPGYIFPIRLDSTDLPGMLDTVAYIDWHAFEPVQIANLICEKLERPEDTAVALPQEHRRSDILRLILSSSTATQIVDFEREIDLFQQMLAGTAPPILLIQDDSGTGKTTLLYKYMEVCETSGALYSFVDFKGGYLYSSEKVLETIAKQTSIISSNASIDDLVTAVNNVRNSAPSRRVVLLLDTFNAAGALETWVVDNLLVPIHQRWIDNLIVVVAGWRVPVLPPEEGDWTESVTRLWQLPRWDRSQIREFGNAIGWMLDENLVDFFFRSTNGQPHVCSMIMRTHYKSLQEGPYERVSIATH
jgi:hypothetical protein